jgi:hypothetical protein
MADGGWRMAILGHLVLDAVLATGDAARAAGIFVS